MATPLVLKSNERTEPRDVQGAKFVDLALVTFTDETNVQHTTLAVVGDKRIHLLEGRELGLCPHTTPKGNASEWLNKAIRAKLEVKKK
jgi:hypothetical protein